MLASDSCPEKPSKLLSLRECFIPENEFRDRIELREIIEASPLMDTMDESSISNRLDVRLFPIVRRLADAFFAEYKDPRLDPEKEALPAAQLAAPGGLFARLRVRNPLCGPGSDMCSDCDMDS